MKVTENNEDEGRCNDGSRVWRLLYRMSEISKERGEER